MEVSKPFCEYNCEYPCNLCLQAIREANAKLAAADDADADMDAWNSYLGGGNAGTTHGVYPIVKYSEEGLPLPSGNLLRLLL